MSTAKIVNPEQIKCTLEFTMTLRDWKKVREALNGSDVGYSGLEIMQEIADLAYQLEKTLYNNTSKDEN